MLGMCGAAAAQESPSAIVETNINGNRTVTITLPFNTNNMGIDHYQFSVAGSGYTWTLTNVGMGQGSAQSGSTIPLSGQDLSLSVTTAGLPVTGSAATTSQYIDFVPCTRSPNVQCFSQNAKRYRFVVDPNVTVTPSATITTDGSGVRTVQLESLVAPPNSAVTAACVKDAGAPTATTIAVSPATRNTDSNGRADFTVTTSGLRLIAASGNAPSGRCTFRAHASSAKTAVVEVLGQRINPTLDVSPSSVSVPTSGVTFVERDVTVDTRPSAYGNVTIDASCTAEAPATVGLDGAAQGSAHTGSKVTIANGEVTFRVRAENLVTVPPTGSPHVRCTFKVRELAATYEYYVSGRQVSPSVSLSTGQITQTGTTSLTATMSPPSCCSRSARSPARGWKSRRTCSRSALPPRRRRRMRADSRPST